MCLTFSYTFPATFHHLFNYIRFRFLSSRRLFISESREEALQLTKPCSFDVSFGTVVFFPCPPLSSQWIRPQGHAVHGCHRCRGFHRSPCRSASTRCSRAQGVRLAGAASMPCHLCMGHRVLQATQVLPILALLHHLAAAGSVAQPRTVMSSLACSGPRRCRRWSCHQCCRA